MRLSLFVLPALLFCLYHPTLAQNQVTSTRSFQGLSVSFGILEDQFKHVTSNNLISRIRAGENPDEKINRYSQIGSSIVSFHGVNLGLALIFDPTPKNDGFRFIQDELRVGANINLQRELMVDSYEKNETNFTPLTFCLLENEVMLQTSYLFKSTLLKGLMTFYLGPQLNVGSTWGNEFILLNQTPATFGDNTFETKKSNYFRGSALFGYSLDIYRIRLQVEGTIGKGVQYIPANEDMNGFRKRAFRLGIAYLFNP